MSKKIAIFTDLHANLEALKAIMDDVKKNDIDEIISLGDLIGLGPNPRECMDVVIDNNIINILGNSEEYTVFGTDCFEYLGYSSFPKCANALWTTKQLTSDQIEYLKKMPYFIEKDLGFKKIALCHFPIDVRYDFGGVWEYGGDRPEYFLKTNTSNDIINSIRGTNKAIQSAKNHPLFNGEPITEYDAVIYGHYHFDKNHTLENVELFSLNGSGVGITDNTNYYILEVKNEKVIVNRVSIPFDYEQLYSKLDKIDYPNKETFKRYINKK